MDSQQKLDTLLTLSHEMLQMATVGEWEQVESLEQQRQNILPDFSMDSLSEFEQEQIRQKLQLLTELNAIILQMGQRARETHRAESQRMATGKKAVSSYSNSF
ncbi:MAG: flagellar protein FliT [Gammaproteobacteria bacterium]|nr:flagellar protein FliT [Gammaproteobacteria bacterium]